MDGILEDLEMVWNFNRFGRLTTIIYQQMQLVLSTELNPSLSAICKLEDVHAFYGQMHI